MKESLYKPDLSRHQDFARELKKVLTDEWMPTPEVINEICGEKPDNPKEEEKYGWGEWSREHTKNVLRSMSDVEIMPDWLESKEEPDAGGKKYYWRLNE